MSWYGLGWEAMLYYTSYLGFWNLSVPDLETFRLMATFHFGELLRYPGLLLGWVK